MGKRSRKSTGAGKSAGAGKSVGEGGGDLGPDPVWGVGVGIVGLLIMAVGGAATWHWVFNVGEAIMLIGAALFLGAVAVTSLRQEPITRAVVAEALGVLVRALPIPFGGVLLRLVSQDPGAPSRDAHGNVGGEPPAGD